MSGTFLQRTRITNIAGFVTGAALLLAMVSPARTIHVLRIASRLSPFLRLSTLAAAPAGKALQVTVLAASQPLLISPPGAEINLETRFVAGAPVPDSLSLVLFLVDSHGTEVARAENSLNNTHTIVPTTTWVGPVTVLTSIALPRLRDGDYAIFAGLYKLAGPVQLSPGPGVTQDDRVRYRIGTLRIAASAPNPPLLPPPTLDLSGYRLTFDEPFIAMSVSDSPVNDGSRWYARNDECCMGTTDGTATAMAGISDPRNPYSLIPGGGLNIRLERNGNAWTSGVLTSVDSHGRGFSQQYGYFEMKARFPAGFDTWPAFWLLSTASKSTGAAAGEIDVVEYIANPGFRDEIATTLHDWSNQTAPAASHHRVPLPSAGDHTYGMLWTASTMTFYFDHAVTFQAPTPAIMQQPYYLLVDLGIGGGWPTEQTPAVNNLQIQYVRAYAR